MVRERSAKPYTWVRIPSRSPKFAFLNFIGYNPTNLAIFCGIFYWLVYPKAPPRSDFGGFMLNLSLHLPSRFRLDLRLVRRRATSIDRVVFSKLRSLRKIKKGSKVSRFFRHLLEQINIKMLIGANLTALALITPFLSQSPLALEGDRDTGVTSLPLVLTTQKSIQYPVKEFQVTQGFKFYHPGIDLDGVRGDAIYPIMPGSVSVINHSRIGYGNAVLINHAKGFISLYAHLSKIEVSQGQEVTFETKIGEMGTTGRSTGDHLHLEIHRNGVPINPQTLLP